MTVRSCRFCGHRYASHEFLPTATVVTDVPCSECPDGVCRDPDKPRGGD